VRTKNAPGADALLEPLFQNAPAILFRAAECGSFKRELTSRKRNRVFSYAGYLEIMNQGIELPG